VNATNEIRSETVAVATRTLVAAGYSIVGVHRQPSHIEFKCDRPSRLGPIFKFLIAITEELEFGSNQVEEITHAAKNQGRAPVFVCSRGALGQLNWAEFLDVMGGAVPPWRVLSTDFGQHLVIASRNELPAGFSGEAWRLFEILAADAFEFCLGQRVRRMGGQRRGMKVSDIVAVLPDFDVIVVDAKASSSGFDAGWDSLRPLVEYVQRQKVRQASGGAVIAALVLSSQFEQDETRLNGVARQFIGETRTSLCFMTASTLAYLVNQLLKQSDTRATIRWKTIFSEGLITEAILQKEINTAAAERCQPRDF
jgi:hypothetical protein